MEVVKKSMESLHKKIKELRESNDKDKVATFYAANLDAKTYTGAAYEAVATIKLPKGKYLLTFNFLLKANSSWLYLYLNEGGSLFPNAGFYSPTSANFIPHTVRKVHTVANESEKVNFMTYCANSYPVTIRNAIITAKRLNE